MRGAAEGCGRRGGRGAAVAGGGLVAAEHSPPGQNMFDVYSSCNAGCAEVRLGLQSLGLDHSMWGMQSHWEMKGHFLRRS